MDDQVKKVFGIDLGTTYSVISTLDSHGNPIIIQNHYDASPLLASAVYFEPGNPEPVVGVSAKNQAQIEPERVVQYIKREIGKEGIPARVFDGLSYDPITISSLILKRMKMYAEEGEQCEVQDVVITCPAYFGIPERNATRQAGELAGLNVLNVINEPTAAALYYLSHAFQEKRTIMVYDLGGGTFDVTLFDVDISESGSDLKVLYSYGDDHLGGVDWDARLVEHLCELYSLENGLSSVEEVKQNSNLLNDIQNEAEKLKVKLSSVQSSSTIVGGTRLTVTREELENLTKDKVGQTMSFVQHVLDHAKMQADDVSTVLLVGGSTRMPMVKAALEAVFPGRVQMEDPDQAVAKGAALAAAIAYNEVILGSIERAEAKPSQTLASVWDLAASTDASSTRSRAKIISIAGGSGMSIAYQDVLNKSFGPGIILREATSDRYVINNLLLLGQDSPAQMTRVYYTIEDNQTNVEISAYENEAVDEFVKPCQDEYGMPQETEAHLKVRTVGMLDLPLPYGTPAGSEVEVTFVYSEKGLDVSAQLLPHGEIITALFQSSTLKSEDEMEEARRHLNSLQTRAEA